LGRYRNLEEPYRNKAISGYKGRGSEGYLASRQYQKPYRNPRPTRSYSKPPMGRGGRGRLDRNSKPEYFQSPKPEKKYESVFKPEKLSSPAVERPLRYTLENNGRAWVDTEQVAREVERRMEGKLTEQSFQKFKGELEDLLRNGEKTPENSSEPTESKTEPAQEVRGVEKHSENEARSGEGQSDEAKTEMIEGDGGSPEPGEESKDADVALEGGFVVSRAFGVAVPTEAEKAELEQVAEESEEQETETVENENAGTQTGQGTEEAEQREINDAETESPENLEAEDESSEVNEGENTEDIEIEDREPDDVIPEEATETEEVEIEPLPEEGELYPVEVEPEC
jgi:hypothetical protein